MGILELENETSRTMRKVGKEIAWLKVTANSIYLLKYTTIYYNKFITNLYIIKIDWF